MHLWRSEELKSIIVERLKQRGISMEEIGRLTLELQRPYNPQLDLAACVESVERVLEKREVQNIILTGLVLDELAENGKLPEPLATIIQTDDCLYGVDELLGLGITNIYGSVGLTSFGYLDKMKSGILKQMNRAQQVGTKVYTFLDDLVAAVAAAASARLAHHEYTKAAQAQARAAGN